MGERTKITAKTPETKKGNPSSKTQNPDFLNLQARLLTKSYSSSEPLAIRQCRGY